MPSSRPLEQNEEEHSHIGFGGLGQPEEMIPPLLRKARSIVDCRRPPKGADGCQNCERLDALMGLLM